MYDDMVGRSGRRYHADIIEARVNIVHPNPRSTNPINTYSANWIGAVLDNGLSKER